MKKIMLEEMTWPEAKEAFSRTDVAIIPTGSIEQHGHHCPLGTDIIIARTIAKRLGEKLGDVIVAPPVSYGFCEYHQGFVAVSVPNEAFYLTFKGIVDSLMKYGIKYFVVINGHGGNKPNIDRVSVEIRPKGGLLTHIQWWETVGALDKKWLAVGHADMIETSAVWACMPEAMRMDQAKPHEPIPLTDEIEILAPSRIRFRGQIMPVWTYTHEATRTGNFGDDPNTGSREIGEEALSTLVDFLADYVKAFRKIKL
ncbi:MAG: creatininase family protein [Bacillota bacterium]|nr:creatininase family protein [Bacillota bacterium]